MNQPEHPLGHVSPVLDTIVLNFFKWAIMLFLSGFRAFLMYRIKKIRHLLVLYNIMHL